VLLVFLSIIIALTLSMPVVKLQAMGFRRSHAIAVSIPSIVGLFILIGFLVLPPLVVETGNLIQDMPAALDAAEKSYEEFRNQNAQLREFLPAITQEGNSFSVMADTGNQKQSITRIFGSALPILSDVGNVLLALVLNVLLIVVVSIYILVDPMDYAQGILMLVPPGYQQRFVEVITELRRSLTAWLVALSFSIGITFVLVNIGMRLWDIPNATGLAAIAAIATVIPNLGVVIPLVPIAIFTLSAHPDRLLFVLGTYMLFQQVESSILSPMVVKRQMDIPVGVVLIFQLVAGTLFGFLGVLLAVPMLGVLITLIREIYVYDILGVRNIELTLEESDEGEFVLSAELTPPDNPS
jgi:predicted PurR-regulated permease PerM